MPRYIPLKPQGRVTHDPTKTINGDPLSFLGDNPFATMTEEIIFGAVNSLLTMIDDVTGLDLLGLVGPLEGLLGTSTGLLSGFFGFLTPGLGTTTPNVFSPLLGGMGLGSLGGFASFLQPTNLLTGAGVLGPLLGSGLVLPGLIPGLDASRIVSGTFGAGLLQPIIDAVSQGFGGSTGLGFGGLQSFLGGLTLGGIGFDDILTLIPGLTGGLSGSTGLGAAFTDLTGLLGSPTALGSGTPVLPGIGSIPLLGGLLSGGTLLGSLIPGLDASKITSGIFGQALIPSLTGVWGNTISSSLLSGVLGAGLIPSLDASKVTTGIFGTGLIPLLGEANVPLLTGLTKAGSNIVVGGTFEDDNIWPEDTYRFRSTAQKHSGTKSYKLVQPSWGWEGTTFLPATNVRVGDIYEAEIWMYRPTGLAANKVPRVFFQMDDSNGVNGTQWFAPPTFDSWTEGAWNRLHGNIVVPTGYDTMVAFFQLATGASDAFDTGDFAYFDDLIVREQTRPQSILDAFKGVTNGTGLISDLTSRIQRLATGGTFDGSYLSGSVASSLLSGVLGSGLIPSLDASKVTTGVFGTGLIPSLPASIITSGVFGQTLIPSLTGGWGNTIASSLLSGVLGAGLIPSLDASKTTTGVFGTGLIPSLPASIITSGVFGQTLIPSLTGGWGNTIASSLLSGVLGAGLIPGLDASKITSGLFSQSMVTNLPTDLSNLLPFSIFGSRIGAGSNLTIDPSFESSNIWSATSVTWYSGIFSTDQKHSGTQSRKITTTASQQAFALVVDPKNNTTFKQLVTQPGQKFYVETWVWPKSTNVNTNANVGIWCQLDDSTGVTGTTWVSFVASQHPTRGQWTKISGYLTIPAGYDLAVPYWAVDTAGTVGDIYYIDDLVTREVTEAQNAIQTLWGSSTIGSSVLASVIPSLDASKTTTGTFGTGLIPNLDVAKITTGVFGAAFIPSLDASKLTTGTLGTARIPDITKGMSLDMQAVIDNVYQAANGGSSTGNTVASVKTSLLNIPGANIISVLGSSVIPSLDASKVTTGTLGTARIPDIARSMSTDLQSTIDQLVQGYIGGSTTGYAPSTLNTTVAANINQRITALEGRGTLTQYTSSATWTNPTPSAHNLITVICINGGQGGGKGVTTSSWAGGAPGGRSGGYVSQQFYTDAIASTISMTIGTGGAGSTTANAMGATGGVTSFGALLSGTPGLGSVFKADGTYAVAVPPGDGGKGGVYIGTGPTSLVTGEAGQSGPFAAGGAPVASGAGNNGAAAPAGIPSGGGGGGGGGGTSSVGTQGAGGAGGFPGGGGGGGGNNTTAANGGAGAAGCIYVIT